MSIKRIVVDVPAEFHERFKISCAKNHTTIKDELTRLICASLDGVTVEDLDEKKVVDDGFDKPVYEKEDLEAKIEAELKAIREEIATVQTAVSKLNAWEDNVNKNFYSWVDAEVKRVPETCPKLEQFKEVDKKFLVLAKLLVPLLWSIKEATSITVCDDDVTAIAFLANEPKDKWNYKGQIDAMRESFKYK